MRRFCFEGYNVNKELETMVADVKAVANYEDNVEYWYYMNDWKEEKNLIVDKNGICTIDENVNDDYDEEENELAFYSFRRDLETRWKNDEPIYAEELYLYSDWSKEIYGCRDRSLNFMYLSAIPRE